MIESLVRDFRRGRVDPKKILRARTDGFNAFHLASAVGVRMPVLQYELPLDDAYLRAVAEAFRKSPLAGGRIGIDWSPRNGEIIRRKEDEDAMWASAEELKPLNDVCTAWCTQKYFPDAFARMNMVANVIRLYDRLAAVNAWMKDFRIAFKGGVMMRLVLLEFFNDLPISVRAKAIAHLNKYRALSISDFDFEIVARDHDGDVRLIHCYITLDYAVLLWLQREMEREIAKGEGHLLYLDWDPSDGARELRAYLQEAVDELPESSSMHGITVDHVYVGDSVPQPPQGGYRSSTGERVPRARRNAAIFNCGDTKCVIGARELMRELEVPGVPHTSGGSRLYATLNTYIGEGEERSRPNHLLSVFHLARIKHAFVMYYTTKDGRKRCDRLGGEMIDLSQSAGRAVDEARVWLYANVERPYRDYPILGVDTDTVIIHSYTVEGFLFEQMSTLFFSASGPLQNKSAKRHARLVAFLFAHVLSPKVAGTRRAKLRHLWSLLGEKPTIPLLRAVCDIARMHPSSLRAIRRHVKALWFEHDANEDITRILVSELKSKFVH